MPLVDRVLAIDVKMAALVVLFFSSNTTLCAQEDPATARYSIESSMELNSSRQKNLSNDPALPGYGQSIEASIDLSLSYRWNERYAFALSVAPYSYSYRFPNEENWDDYWLLELSEFYFSFSPAFALNHELSLGKQSISNDPEWWDTSIDGIALRGESDRNSYFISAGFPVTDYTSEQDIRDPADEDVYWLFSSATVGLTSDSVLTGFLLREFDQSALPAIGDLVDRDNVDEQDRTLTWHGFRYEHESLSTPIGIISGRFNGSFVHGKETNLELSDPVIDALGNESDSQEVASIVQTAVSGWALDSSLQLEIPLGVNPTITIAYATGSGTRGWQPESSGSYRQSGSQSYGRLYDPELSNISIGSVGVYLPIREGVAVDLTHYQFNKRRANDSIGMTGLEIEPTDLTSRDLGSESVLALNLQLLAQLELELDLTWSIFDFGRAYGDESASARLINVEIFFEF